MKAGRRTVGSLLGTILLVGAMEVGQANAQTQVAAKPDLDERSSPAADLSNPASPEDFVTLEVRETDLVLTNISDRPIVAWMVRQVLRITRDNEGWTGIGEDHFRHSLFPDGDEGLLQPGESIVLDRPEDPWVREDAKGPEFAVYYDVGALVFENAEWVGRPEVADRIFNTRLDVARTALEALEVANAAEAGNVGVLEDLPTRYRGRLDLHPSRVEALRAIRDEAREDYQVALGNLRAEDLARLQLEEKEP